MDLRLHAAVIWRWRLVVAAGLALAIGLTFFSFFRVSFADGYSLQYRQGKTWQSTETLLLTQGGCALGQVTCSSQSIVASSIAPLYAQMANSGVIRARVLPHGLTSASSGDYLAFPVTDSSTGGQQVLPFLEFAGTGSTPKEAVEIARRAVTVFLTYLNESSNSSNISKSNRVVLQVVSAATVDNAKVVKGRKKTAPILVFLAVIIVTLGLAYLLENLFPRAVPAGELKLTPLEAPDGDESARFTSSEPTVEPIESIKPPPHQAAAAADPSKS